MTEPSQRFPLLLSLPPELLRPIFLLANLPATSIAICKDLLPYTENAAYCKPDLYSSREIELFASTVLKRPELAKACVGICLSRKTEHVPLRQKLYDLVLRGGASLSSVVDGTAEDASNGDDADDARSFVPTEEHYRTGTAFGLKPVKHETLIELFRALVNLEYCATVGAELTTVLLDDFYIPGAARHLNTLLCVMSSGDIIEQWGHDHARMFVNAQKLPALRFLDVSGSAGSLPFVFDGTGEAKAGLLLPRTWELSDLNLSQLRSCGTELKQIFQSLSEAVAINLEVLEADDSLADSIAALPTTVLHLSLTVFCAFHGDQVPAGVVIPKVNNIGDVLPNLHHFHITGPIFDPPALLASLRNAPHLTCILFGIDTPVPFENLITLVKGDSALPNLMHLSISICHCPVVAVRAPGVAAVRNSTSRKPRWTDDMTRNNAKELLEACKEAGLSLRGTILCALKQCEHGRAGGGERTTAGDAHKYGSGVETCPREGGKCA